MSKSYCRICLKAIAPNGFMCKKCHDKTQTNHVPVVNNKKIGELKNQQDSNSGGWVDERMLEEKLYNSLRLKGLNPQRQVKAEYGIIDILTANTIYEVKLKLDYISLQRGLGQLLMHRLSYPIHQLVLAGQSNKELGFVEVFKHYDIDIMVLTYKDLGDE